MSKPKVAVIGTGGTIASLGAHPLDVQDYASSGLGILDAEALVAGVADLARVADVLAVPFAAIASTAIGWDHWRALVAKIMELKAAHPDLAGVVVTHGTATLDPLEFVRTIACARITMPKAMVRLSAGRQEMGDAIQALCFLAGANSIFYGEKLLTTGNPDIEKDQSLFARLGLQPMNPAAT